MNYSFMDNPIYKLLSYGLSAIVGGKALNWLIVGFIGITYYTSAGFFALNKLDSEQNVNFSNQYFIVSSASCSFLVDESTANIISGSSKTGSSVGCPPTDRRLLKKLMREHYYGTRGINSAGYWPFFWAFIVVNLLFMGLDGISETRVQDRKVSEVYPQWAATMVAVSILMFIPIFLNNDTGATVELYGADYYVSSVYLTDDGNRIVTLPTSYFGKIYLADAAVVKPVNWVLP